MSRDVVGEGSDADADAGNAGVVEFSVKSSGAGRNISLATMSVSTHLPSSSLRSRPVHISHPTTHRFLQEPAHVVCHTALHSVPGLRSWPVPNVAHVATNADPHVKAAVRVIVVVVVATIIIVGIIISVVLPSFINLYRSRACPRRRRAASPVATIIPPGRASLQSALQPPLSLTYSLSPMSTSSPFYITPITSAAL